MGSLFWIGDSFVIVAGQGSVEIGMGPTDQLVQE